MPHRPAEKEPIRVAIVEDRKISGNHLADVVGGTSSLRLVRVISNTGDALEELGLLKPGVVVMNIRLPNRKGIECTRFLKQRHPEMQIVMFTSAADGENVMKALKAGASGYLLSNSTDQEIVRGIELVWEGGVPMSPGITRMVVEALHSPGEGTEDDRKQMWQLTDREHEIMQLLSKGFSAKEMAEHLHVSEATSRFHLKNIYCKLHVHSHTQALAKYLA